MKKKFKAKVSGMFDIVQLGDDTFSLKDWLEAKPDIERFRRIKGTKSPCQLKHF